MAKEAADEPVLPYRSERHPSVVGSLWDFSGTSSPINRHERERTERPFAQVSGHWAPIVAGHSARWSLPGHLKALRDNGARPLLTCAVRGRRGSQFPTPRSRSRACAADRRGGDGAGLSRPPGTRRATCHPRGRGGQPRHGAERDALRSARAGGGGDPARRGSARRKGAGLPRQTPSQRCGPTRPSAATLFLDHGITTRSAGGPTDGIPNTPTAIAAGTLRGPRTHALERRLQRPGPLRSQHPRRGRTHGGGREVRQVTSPPRARASMVSCQ